ncbi:MAG: hypothetical protein ABR555_17170 [Pyrinomonadaceae bacterium]
MAFLIGAGLIYVPHARDNPPGFYADESSIAYNSYLISTTGRDEHGVLMPLFFRAFGDYKNPVYIYLLAAVFRLTGPGILAARLLSVFLGITTVLMLMLLAIKVSRNLTVAAIAGFMTLLTPWLFELSRVVIEVAMYPFVIVLFLLALHRVARKYSWSAWDMTLLALTLTLTTYTYSTGRLLGPLLAIGLIIFAGVVGWRYIAITWAVYAALLAPILVFHRYHPGALSGRFALVSYLNTKSNYFEIASEFLNHYVRNFNPWRMVVLGDPNTHQIATVYGSGLVLVSTLLLALAGVVVIIVRRRNDRWWMFVIYFLLISVVPASLTKEHFHMLRLSALPVVLLLLTVPALERLVTFTAPWKWVLVGGVLAVGVVQGAAFQSSYRASVHSPWRRHLFDADYSTTILASALNNAADKPIYVADAPSIPGYIQAFWYGLLSNVPREKFIVLPPSAGPPEGAVAITTENSCPRCQMIAETPPYVLYRAVGAPRVYSELPAAAYAAQIRLVTTVDRMAPSEEKTIVVAVTNLSPVLWPARERAASPFQISAGNHWLGPDGRMLIGDDGRGPLLADLSPATESLISLTVNAPPNPGEYVLEIDMLQEGVSWFARAGSKSLKVPVRVK